MAKGATLVEQWRAAKKDAEALAEAKAFAEELGADVVADVDSQLQVPTRAQVKSLGEQVVKSDVFTNLIKAHGGRFADTSRIQTAPIGVKALVTGQSDTSGGAFITPENSGILEMLGRRPLTVRDLVSVRPTSSDAVTFVKQTSSTNGATVVAEAKTAAAPTAPAGGGALVLAPNGGYYPESGFEFTRETVNVKDIATWVPVTKNALADVASLEALLNQELTANLAEVEESQLMSGDGTGDNFRGILQTSGLQAQAFDTDIFTTVRRAITKARVVGRVAPNAVLLSPIDVETIDLARENGTAGKFIGAGPFVAGQRTLWGVPVVESQGLAAGSGLVGDFSKAIIWDRQQATVEFTDSHADFFTRGLLAARATERLAFGVTRPQAFVKAAVAG